MPCRRGHADAQGCSVGAPYPTSGVMGAEIWGWVAWAPRPRTCAPPPTGPSELSFLSVDTRTPYVADYPGKDGGETAHYMLRWVSTGGAKGPWSETASATIGAQVRTVIPTPRGQG